MFNKKQKKQTNPQKRVCNIFLTSKNTPHEVQKCTSKK